MQEFCAIGVTGFIGAYLVKSLLEKGYTVRTTVRDPGDVEKDGFLMQFAGAKERLKIMKADLLVNGNFDEAIQGVDGVFHTASPLVVHDKSIKDTLIDPIIKGISNVLTSCAKSATVRRVEPTSSCSSIGYPYDLQRVLCNFYVV